MAWWKLSQCGTGLANSRLDQKVSEFLGRGVKWVSELICLCYHPDSLSLFFVLSLVSISKNLVIRNLIEIVPCSFSHPLCQCFLTGQANQIPGGAQSLPPTQGLGPTLRGGSPFCRQPPPHCWIQITPCDTWGAVASTSCTEGITAHGQGNGTKEITLPLQVPRWGKSTTGPKGWNSWGQKLLPINNWSLQKQY